MEQLVFLLIFAVIGFINWLVQKSAEKREAARKEAGTPTRPASPWQAPRPVSGPMDDFGDAARRLREALGLPADAEPPRPVARPAEPPALPGEPAAPAAPVILFERKLREYELDLERRLVEEPAPVPAPVVRSFVPPAAPIAPEPRRAGPLDELLRTREGLRKAVLIQEVLGTPKGMVF